MVICTRDARLAVKRAADWAADPHRASADLQRCERAPGLALHPSLSPAPPHTTSLIPYPISPAQDNKPWVAVKEDKELCATLVAASERRARRARHCSRPRRCGALPQAIWPASHGPACATQPRDPLCLPPRPRRRFASDGCAPTLPSWPLRPPVRLANATAPLPPLRCRRGPGAPAGGSHGPLHALPGRQDPGAGARRHQR